MLKNTHTQTVRKHVPCRMLLYQVCPCEIEQQLYRVGTERPPSSPGFLLFPSHHLLPFVPICGWTNPWPISSCPGCKGVTIHLYQMVWQKKGCGTLVWCFLHFNMYTNPCISWSNADPNSLVLGSPKTAFLTSSQDPSHAPGLWSGPHLVKHESKTYWFSSKMYLRDGKLPIFGPNLLENCLNPVFCLGLRHFGFWEIEHRTIK